MSCPYVRQSHNFEPNIIIVIKGTRNQILHSKRSKITSIRITLSFLTVRDDTYIKNLIVKNCVSYNAKRLFKFYDPPCAMLFLILSTHAHHTSPLSRLPQTMHPMLFFRQKYLFIHPKCFLCFQ